MTRIKQLQSWEDFKQRLSSYFQLTPSRREQFLFRGQRNANWPLNTTLDRLGPFATSELRELTRQVLLREFRRLAAGLFTAGTMPSTSRELELLARHHGLPTPVMDWTESPYIAAFFAFDAADADDTDHVAVWVVDREKLASDEFKGIEILGDEVESAFNVRANEQRGVFMRVSDDVQSYNSLLSDVFFKFELPVSEREAALRELDEMLVNSRQLFRDLDGAARTAIQRCETTHGRRA